MSNHQYDVQGRLLGMLPYDFRRPTLAKVVARVYQPGGPMLVPKAFGAGWTFNLAHRGSRWLLGACLVAAALAVVAG
jgi:hypothetical protein